MFCLPQIFRSSLVEMVCLHLPPHVIEKAKEELSALRLLSENQFNLRVGIVRLSILEEQGSQVLVAKHQMDNGQHLAMFSGGGLSLAEDLIKGDIEQYGVPVMDKETVNLERLSCRWQPIPSTNGVMLSILVQALKLIDTTSSQIRRIQCRTESDLRFYSRSQSSQPRKNETKKWIGDSQIEFSNQPKEMEVAPDTTIFLARILSALDQRWHKV